MKKTKIVCTLGPASSDEATLASLMRAGMDVVRLNFSHGTHEVHRATSARARAVAERLGHPLAVLQDLQGPKIRVGKLPGGSVTLVAGTTVRIAPGEEPREPGVVPTTYLALARDVHAGDGILLDDGLLRMHVESVQGDEVVCRVDVGGVLKDRKGINLPGVAVSAPSLSAKDLDDMALGVELGVDFLCVSFVRSAEDVRQAKERLAALGSTTPVIAKIEKPQAVAALDAILDAADGIMVARGDLGVEMGPEKVPLIQKHAIEQANRRGKLVITATQMLESMVHSTFPTRAEASDVANAVLDNSDALMLSGETATGDHPELAVRTMTRIIEEIEASERYRAHNDLPPLDLSDVSNAVAHAAAAAARSMPQVTAIVCVSYHGRSPTLLSDYRPEVPIYALLGDGRNCHRMAAFWGVQPFAFERAHTTEETLARVEAELGRRNLVKPGDTIILTLAVPPGPGHHTNTLKVHRIGG
ncbi:MAG: pyruvate kinase [Myxococcales bacterium]|nr:pyruvate kinase [Myxococcales bacterium]